MAYGKLQEGHADDQGGDRGAAGLCVAAISAGQECTVSPSW